MKKLLFIVVFMAAGALAAQGNSSPWQVDSTIVPGRPLRFFTFPDRHLPVKESLEIYLNKRRAQPVLDFRLEDTRIRFVPPPQKGDTVRIRYRRYPINLKRRYTLFKKDTLTRKESGEIAAKKRVIISAVDLGTAFEDFGSGLKKRGSIARGVNIGSNRDLTLSSGLNLELSGQLNENIEIIAALTDETTPIQPEGNTQTLDEIDRVFVQFKSPVLDGTVGDIYYDVNTLRFGNLKRKLQGINLSGKYKGHRLELTGATTRGLIKRQIFIGREGNQGPYQLTGNNGEREIIVLAGTEQVWLDGQKMSRGESNDYVIEYGNGEIRFTNKRLITGESRIEVDFEFFPAGQKFNRDAYGATYEGALGSGLSYSLRYFRESDSKERLLGRESGFTSAEKEVLRRAGNDPFRAFVSGASEVGAGKGRYIRADTLYADSLYRIYKYVGRGGGDYRVSFSYVGRGNGSYTRDRLGQYRWIGPSRGDYEPVKLLPLPQDHQLADLDVKWRIDEKTDFKAEYAFSRFDPNTFSALDNSRNNGQALFMRYKTRDRQIALFGLRPGRFTADISATYVDDRFQSLDRLNKPDYQRYWNVLTDNLDTREEKSLQFNGSYFPTENINLRLNGGLLNKAGQRTRRVNSALEMRKSSWGRGEVDFTYLRSRQENRQIDNTWRRLQSEYGYGLGGFEPQLIYRFENRRNQTPALVNGFRYDDVGLRLNILDWWRIKGFAQYQTRYDQVYDVERQGRLTPQSVARTARLHFELTGVPRTALTVDVLRRQKVFEERFKNIRVDTLKLLYADATVQDTVWQDNATNLADVTFSHSRWKNALRINAKYRISTDQTALREKVYIKVEPGRGNLRFDTDLQEYVPDPDGDYVLFIVSSGRFEPVTRLNSALRLTYDGAAWWRKPGHWWQVILKNLSGNSYLRADEETREPDVASIYLLNLSRFQGAYTLRGALVFDQDLYIMKRNRALNFRIQYRYRDDRFNQFLDAADNEDRLNVERALRMDWRIIPALKSQTEVRGRFVTRNSRSNVMRNRNISGLLATEKITWRLNKRWEARLETEYGREENRTDNYPLSLWYGLFKPQLNFIIPGKARLSLNYEYQTVRLLDNPLNLTVPYEMARGRKEGLSQRWQARMEYNITKNVLFNFSYSGRNDAGLSRVIHTGQAEVRAYF